MRLLSKHSKHGNGRLNISINKQDISAVDAVELSTAPNQIEFLLDFTIKELREPAVPVRNRRPKRFKFNPNKNVYAEEAGEGGSFNNGERAEHAQEIMEYQLIEILHGPETDEVGTSEMGDIISNLGHYCDREGLDFGFVLFNAVMTWEAERGHDSSISISH